MKSFIYIQLYIYIALCICIYIYLSNSQNFLWQALLSLSDILCLKKVKHLPQIAGMVIKLSSLSFKLTLLYFAFWYWDQVSANHISVLSFGLILSVGVLKNETRSRKKYMEHISFSFLLFSVCLPICFLLAFFFHEHHHPSSTSSLLQQKFVPITAVESSVQFFSNTCKATFRNSSTS